jgi:hypothetical protein
MATCTWCGKRRKTLKTDILGRCEDCQEADRYPTRPTRSGVIRSASTDYQGAPNGGRKTFPVGEAFQDNE